MKNVISITLSAGLFVFVSTRPAFAGYLEEQEMAQANAAKHAAEAREIEFKKQAEFAAAEQKHLNMEKAEVNKAEEAKILTTEAEMHHLQSAEAMQAAENAKHANRFGAIEQHELEKNESKAIEQETMKDKAVEKARDWALHHLP